MAQSQGAPSLRAHSCGRESLGPLTQSLSCVAEVRARSTRLPVLTARVCLPTPARFLCPTGGKGYGPEHGEEDFAAFRAWLQCYGVPGMSSLRDRRGRTIWFQVWALTSHRQMEILRKLVGWIGLGSQ